MINAHLSIPAIMTNTPPPKIIISETFRLPGIWARHSTGMGMDIKYMSVTTLSTTVTYRLILEIAG